MAFSSDFSASVALCCISVAVSAPFESMLLAHADFANSGSEDFWDNLSWMVNFSCYKTWENASKTSMNEIDPSKWEVYKENE